MFAMSELENISLLWSGRLAMRYNGDVIQSRLGVANLQIWSERKSLRRGYGIDKACTAPGVVL